MGTNTKLVKATPYSVATSATAIDGPIDDEAPGLPRELRSASENAFALSDAILAANVPSAHKIVGDLLENRESSIAILGVLSRHERNACAFAGASNPGSVKLPAFVAKKYLSRYKSKGSSTFKHTFKSMSQADIELKSTSVDDTLLLSELLEKIESSL